MKKTFIATLFVVICGFVHGLPNYAADNKSKANAPDLFIDCVFSENTIYERQPVSVVITLFSSTPDVETASAITEPKLSKGEFSTLQQVQPAGNAYRKLIDGKEFFCFPLKTFVFTIDEKGSYELSDGEYKIGIAIPVVINDPFWGRVSSSEIKDYDVPVKKSSFKVKSLPKQSQNASFSGSVGEFKLETVLPRGDCFVNEEATVYIVLRGTGMIAESVLPEYRNAFGEDLKLKSVSESRTEGYDNGKMVSELRLECTFIPLKSGEISIGESYFDYFDPSAGKYVKTSSKPIKVLIKSSVSKRESLSI